MSRQKKINLNLVKTLDPITDLQNHHGQRNILNDRDIINKSQTVKLYKLDPVSSKSILSVKEEMEKNMWDKRDLEDWSNSNSKQLLFLF